MTSAPNDSHTAPEAPSPSSVMPTPEHPPVSQQHSEMPAPDIEPARNEPIPTTLSKEAEAGLTPVTATGAEVPPAPPAYVSTDPVRDPTQPGAASATPRVTQEPPIPTIADSKPVNIFCPYCNTRVLTKVEEKIGTSAGCFAAILCLVCWPCFWVPLVASPCLDKLHHCPNCNRVIAINQK
ncbi:MAG: LITAF-like zinc ribbon domain-containing protein [Piptocephalis tieghemiana]|nr:MAG: LITAF-like zinc ribbon domain-containing protein [Piptocephalis tieghemiana]